MWKVTVKSTSRFWLVLALLVLALLCFPVLAILAAVSLENLDNYIYPR